MKNRNDPNIQNEHKNCYKEPSRILILLVLFSFALVGYGVGEVSLEKIKLSPLTGEYQVVAGGWMLLAVKVNGLPLMEEKEIVFNVVGGTGNLSSEIVKTDFANQAVVLFSPDIGSNSVKCYLKDEENSAVYFSFQAITVNDEKLTVANLFLPGDENNSRIKSFSCTAEVYSDASWDQEYAKYIVNESGGETSIEGTYPEQKTYQSPRTEMVPPEEIIYPDQRLAALNNTLGIAVVSEKSNDEYGFALTNHYIEINSGKEIRTESFTITSNLSIRSVIEKLSYYETKGCWVVQEKEEKMYENLTALEYTKKIKFSDISIEINE